jgi:YidC/Oxa1 family membrane protein insertase
MGQQFVVIRHNPVPGTPAAEAKAKRDAEKRARKGGGVDPAAPATGTVVEAPPAAHTVKAPPPRQQPKRTTREQRKKQRPATGPDVTR